MKFLEFLDRTGKHVSRKTFEKYKKHSNNVTNAFSKMLILRGKDIQRGFMDESWEPASNLISAEDNELCWKYLAKVYTMALVKNENSTGECLATDDYELFIGWQLFLQTVKNVIMYESENKGIENIINKSGIERKTLAIFLDQYS